MKVSIRLLPNRILFFEFMQNKHMEQSISLASEVQKCFASAKRNNRGSAAGGFPCAA